jgi:hypothetical protein
MIEDTTTGTDYASAGEQFSRNVAQSLASAELNGARIDKRYVAKDGTTYALAYLPKDNAWSDANKAAEQARLQSAEFANWKAQDDMKKAFYDEQMKGKPVSE